MYQTNEPGSDNIVTLSLTNSMGSLIWVDKVSVKVGINTFELTDMVKQSGLYILNVQSNNLDINQAFKLIRK